MAFPIERDLELISYQPYYSGNRDALSFFFETKGDYSIKVHRVFYSDSDFNLLLRYRNNLDLPIRELDISDSTREIKPNALVDALRTLTTDESLFAEAERLYGALVNLLAHNGMEYDLESFENRISFVERLNAVFYGYKYLAKKHRFIRDTATDEIDSLIREIPFNPDNNDGFNEGTRPHIESIEDDDASNYEFRVYNVGQACCSALIKYIDDDKSDYRVIAVFDMGFQRTHGRKNASLEEMLHKVDEETMVMISHFHQDHINNVTRHCGLRTNRWVFPSCDPNKHKAYKLFQALLLIAKRQTPLSSVYVFSTPYELSSSLSIHQHKGKASDPYQLRDDVSAQSLVCILAVAGKRILIPGDALYEEYDTIDLSKPFDYVIVPHHGCRYCGYGSADGGMKIDKVVGRDTVGIVSCGSNTYGHANESHLSWYSNPYLFSNAVIYDDYGNEIRTHRTAHKDYYAIRFS